MVYKKTVNCNTENLHTLRHFVAETLSKQSVTQEQIDLLVLAVDEVCANRIIHSNHCDPDMDLEVNVKMLNGQICFEIMDEGSCFDPNTYQSPSIEQVIHEKKAGRMGLILVKRIMDDIKVEQHQSKHILKLYKRI
ncbi:ATP-binding protein [Sediminitomix flava]|uniref:Serine/threonine-protein kinase RsbW n=1 Tax=Sediminitomix flava TaxID=379075 RepID=A0A315YZ27_SEDFL|nr:ATP-binding protein [Sediminitomix flava]PWJ34158.1 serine/threonine-protein kinase RsbW [Sediminitomix flava]